MEFLKSTFHIIIYNVLVIFLLFAIFIYGKKVTVHLDDRVEVVRTNIISVDYFANRYAQDNNVSDFVYEVNHDNDSLLNNSHFSIKSKKTVTVLYGDKEYEISSYAADYEELSKITLKEIGINLDEEPDNQNITDYDVSFVFRNETHKIEDGLVLELVKIQEYVISEEKDEYLPLKEIPDDNMMVGARVVQSQGTPNVYKEHYAVIKIDDDDFSKVLISKELVKEGSAGSVKVGTKSVTFNPENGNVWDQLAKCESGGNWASNTGNGFYGGLQFSADSWRRASKNVGITIPYAHQASREVQIQVAEDWLSRTSWAQWPACSKKIGLR